MAPLLVQIGRRGTTVNRSALKHGAGLIPGPVLQGLSCQRGIFLLSFRVLFRLVSSSFLTGRCFTVYGVPGGAR